MPIQAATNNCFCNCSQRKNLESIHGKLYFIHLIFSHDVKVTVKPSTDKELPDRLQAEALGTALLGREYNAQ